MIWEQIRANRRRSAVLITLMLIVLILLGVAGGEALLGNGGGVIGLGVALIIWGVQMAMANASPESFLLSGAVSHEMKREEFPRLFNVVDEMVIASGLGYTPRVFVIDDPGPNAFAIGRKPQQSAVAVTTGLLHRLNRDELQGVVAHEIGHLKNRDTNFMTLAAVLLGTIVILAEVLLRAFRYGSRGRARSSSRGGGQAQAIFLLIAVLLAILGPLMAQLLYFACSRKREYLADGCGAQFTRYPEGLASALEKISQAHLGPAFASKAVAPMFIINPLQADGAGGSSLFSTHPPTVERVRILRSMAGASLSDYEAAFRKARGRGLISAESLHGVAAQTIRPASDQGPVQTRADTRGLVASRNGYLSVHCTCGVDFAVPPGFPLGEVRCIRCGRSLELPRAVPPAIVPPVIAAPPVQAPLPPLQYTRRGAGWESFRCECGRPVQLSPAFAGSRVRCGNCGREIEIATQTAA